MFWHHGENCSNEMKAGKEKSNIECNDYEYVGKRSHKHGYNAKLVTDKTTVHFQFH